MVADIGPSLSPTPQAFTPTTWRLESEEQAAALHDGKG